MTLHEKLVRRLVELGATRYKFAEALRKRIRPIRKQEMQARGVREGDIVPGTNDEATYTADDPALARICLVPDAFVINDTKREVTAFEVEVTTPLSNERHRLYTDLFFLLDEYYWTLKLINIDDRGYAREVALP